LELNNDLQFSLETLGAQPEHRSTLHWSTPNLLNQRLFVGGPEIIEFKKLLIE
jgi:hypothetical protein